MLFTISTPRCTPEPWLSTGQSAQLHPSLIRHFNGLDCCYRDIKPDNIGFTPNGTVKLFDFGLCTCVKSREEATECYNMTGNTGSLRYMVRESAIYLSVCPHVSDMHLSVVLFSSRAFLRRHPRLLCDNLTTRKRMCTPSGLCYGRWGAIRFLSKG
jgi:serine/threonine protein kinase